MADQPAGTVVRTDVVSAALWEQAGHDPALYVFYLREAGELVPRIGPVKLPRLNLSLLPTVAMA